MKKVLKNRIFIIITTMIMCVSGTLYAANKYQANQVIYSKKDGTTIDLNTALDELYSKENEIVAPILLDSVSSTAAHGLAFLFDVSNISTLSYSSLCAGENIVRLYYSNTRPNVGYYATNVGSDVKCGNKTLDVSNYKYLNITLVGTDNHFKIVSYS